MAKAYETLRVYEMGSEKSTNEVKLDSFASLQPGWSYGEGVAPSRVVLDRARTILSVGEGLGLRANVFPGIHGSVGVAFYEGQDVVEAVVGDDGAIDVHVERGQGFQFQRPEPPLENVTVREVFERLTTLSAGGQWNSRESSILGTLISTGGGSRTSLLSLLPDLASEPPMAKLAFQS